MTVQTDWRLARLFDVPGHGLAALANALARLGPRPREAARHYRMRLGVADAKARVLRECGSAIEGLYATGMSIASAMGRACAVA